MSCKNLTKVLCGRGLGVWNPILANKSERKYSERNYSYCEGHKMKQNMALYEEL